VIFNQTIFIFSNDIYIQIWANRYTWTKYTNPEGIHIARGPCSGLVVAAADLHPPVAPQDALIPVPLMRMVNCTAAPHVRPQIYQTTIGTHINKPYIQAHREGRAVVVGEHGRPIYEPRVTMYPCVAVVRGRVGGSKRERVVMQQLWLFQHVGIRWKKKKEKLI
jgi:hypothetical protein